MTKRKYNKFLDIVTVLVILFPLIMCLFTARSNGTFTDFDIASYVAQFDISPDLTDLIERSLGRFEFAIDGDFSRCAFIIMSNALLIWLFRVFLVVMTFIPKFSIKLLNMFVRDND